MTKNGNTKHANAFIKTSLLFALLGTAGFMRAETIDITISGEHFTTGETFSGSGYVTLPNGLVTAGLGDVQGFEFNITDHSQGSAAYPNGYIAYFSALFSDLTAFQADFGPSGNLLDLTLQATGGGYDPLLQINNLEPTYGPNAVIQDNDYVTADLSVADASAPEPLSLALCGLGLGMAGLWGMRRRKA